MYIIFEGFDRCGKTEIAKELSKHLNVPYYKCKVEQNAFHGTYDPDEALKYEPRKMCELLEQGVLKNIIVDRDFPSSFAYGPLFRKQQYDAIGAEEIIWDLDKRFYPQNTIYIYCYKTEHNNYDDEYVKLEHANFIKARYELFMTRSFNRALFLDTTDENLDNQIKTINNFICCAISIDTTNSAIVGRTDDFAERKENIYSAVRFPGIFYGNDILFVGQNPGQPNIDDELSVKLHTTPFDLNTEFKAWELQHHISYRASRFYKFMAAFAKNSFGLNSKQWSFTNIVKFSTVDNEAPTPSIIDERLLKQQIAILMPKRVISFGKSAHESLTKMKIGHDAYYHPSYFRYTKTEPLN